jgi:cellulose synthase/poly-beta-1,6-N-acetylglucosamine synthase-like glycosyltransferase
MLAKRLRVYLFLIDFRIVRWLILRISPKLKVRARRFLLQRAPNPNQAPQHQSQATWIKRHYESQCISKSFKGEEIKFSIILPVYKVEISVFKALLESLNAQTYKNFEVCIAAHGTTPKIESEILKWSNSNRLEIKFEFSPTNDGISSTSNRALEMASGDFCVLLDHDDSLPPHAIRLLADGIEKCRDVTLLYTDKETISEKGETINGKQIANDCFTLKMVTTASNISNAKTAAAELSALED